LKNPFTYKGAYGYYYDEETGLYYLKARYYDPKIYRFISRDPIEKAPELADLQNPLSLNPYLYCEDDPVNHTDSGGYHKNPSFTSP
jgi:RHS repeat-associated protein